MRRFLWLPILIVALAIPAAVMASGEEDRFDKVLTAVEGKYRVKATRVPMMGLVTFVARKASHGGVAQMHVAEFDDFTARVDGAELARLVEQELGSGWERMIRETSRKGGEQTLIYVHPEGNRMGMFIVDLEGNELDVVQFSVDPEHLNDSIHRYDHRNGDKAGGEQKPD